MHKDKASSIRQRSPLLLAITYAMAFSVNIAMAQDDADNQDDDFTGLEEVMVTASRRAENLQDVGISLTVFSELELV